MIDSGEWGGRDVGAKVEVVRYCEAVAVEERRIEGGRE